MDCVSLIMSSSFAQVFYQPRGFECFLSQCQWCTPPPQPGPPPPPKTPTPPTPPSNSVSGGVLYGAKAPVVSGEDTTVYLARVPPSEVILYCCRTLANWYRKTIAERLTFHFTVPICAGSRMSELCMGPEHAGWDLWNHPWLPGSPKHCLACWCVGTAV